MEWNQEQFVNDETSRRGVCRGFSFGSRRRMLDRLNQVSVGADLPDFVTLTLPDDSFDDCVERFAKTAKSFLDVLLKRLHRACPSACGFWRIEWKARKSGLHGGKLFPHFHLLVWGLPQRFLGKDWRGVSHEESFIPVRDCQQSFSGLCEEVLKTHVFKSVGAGHKFADRKLMHTARVQDADHIAAKVGVQATFMSFFDWVSLAWYHVVGTGNVDHFLAGCRVERIRSWGIFNRANMPWAKIVEIDLDDEVGIRIRRVARHYLSRRLGRRVQRHFGMTLYCDVAQFKRLIPPDTPF